MKEIKIVEVKEITTQDGKKFNAYKAEMKGGKLMDVRFRRDVTNLPKEPCTIVINENGANVDTTRRYPVLWVNAVEEIKPIERKSNLGQFFD